MKSTVGTNAKILLVDDNVEYLQLMKDELESSFSQVYAVERAKKGLEILEKHKIHCVVTDYRMPEMDGLTFISKINQKYPQLPVILATGNGADPKVLDAIEEGLFDYVDKPYPPAVLINRIFNALLVPRLENLVIDLVAKELPEIKVDRLLIMGHKERLQSLAAMEGLIRTRLLSKKGKPE